MAPTFYHYWPAPMDDQWKGGSPRSRWLGLLVGVLVVLVVGLITALSIYVVRYESRACQDGLQMERQCHNTTQLLEKQLTQIREGFLKAETRANSCNRTVEKLKSQELKQQKRVEDLEGKVRELNQELQETLAELQQLRRENAASSQATPIVHLSMSLLLLGLSILLL